MRWAVAILSALPAFAAIPTPEAHFGHAMGADRKLVRWSDVVRYFQSLDANSEALRLERLGFSTEGRPMVAAIIAAPETLADAEKYREIVARLADPRSLPPEDAETLVAEGKPIVMITCSVHSSEVASTMTAAQFAHDLLTQDTPRHRAILENAILLLVPSLNPDGVDKVRRWYDEWLGGPYEGAPMVELYHKYTGHDLNRDWYFFSQRETRLAAEKLHNHWRPQIVYDVHQMGTDGARIFIPPWVDPVDPNIDPLIVQQVNAFGMAMAVDLTARGKRGVLVNGIYDYYTPARHYQSYHGALRLLSESASVRYATPIDVEPSSLKERNRNYNARESSWNFLEPWEGGTWRLQDIVDNQLITFESVLYTAALRREDLLRNFYTIGERIIARGQDRAYVVPADQHDPNAAVRLLQTLQFGNVEIERVLETPDPESDSIREGDALIRLAQPFGSFAETLLDVQNYPNLRQYPGGPPLQPYDVTAHSLPLLMGVRAHEYSPVDDLATEIQDQVHFSLGRVDEASELMMPAGYDSVWIAVNRLLKEGVPVHRRASDGAFLIKADPSLRDRLGRLASELGVDFRASGSLSQYHPVLRRPRIAVYAGHVPIMDEGWTRWLLRRYEFQFDSVGNEGLLDNLADRYDVLILADANPAVLERGYANRYGEGESIVPPEYREGIGTEGAAALLEFASSGGTIIALNRASEYAIKNLGLPVENAVERVDRKRFYAPGTLVNVRPDVSDPLCYGMRTEEAAWFESGPVFRITAAANATAAVTYPESDILASGWLLGEAYVANRASVVRVSVGEGQAVLFGIRPQYRGQSVATMKLFFNGLFLGATRSPQP